MTLASDDIRIRARRRDAFTEITVLMPHPMETGLRLDGSGALLPAHHITTVRVTLAGRTVLEARLTMAVSRDPLFGFRCRGGQAGDVVAASWTDNRGGQRSAQTQVV